MQFILKIDVGNAAMSSYEDLAQALMTVTGQLEELAPYPAQADGIHVPIRDINGNTVGRWEVSE